MAALPRPGRLALAAALALLAACAAAPPPILDLSGHVCTPSPELITAPPVPLSNPGHPSPVELRIDETAHCLDTAQGKSLYAAFTLTGALAREVDSGVLQFRGDSLTALIRAHPGERYLVVASTPQTVGQTNSRIVERTSETTSSSNGVSVTIHTGTDEARTFVYAHGGKITVYAAAIPGAEPQR